MIQNSSELNGDLMRILVESKQAELRRSARPLLPSHEAGAIRARMGRAVIRLGERIGGADRTPAPAHPDAHSLATP